MFLGSEKLFFRLFVSLSSYLKKDVLPRGSQSLKLYSMSDVIFHLSSDLGCFYKHCTSDFAFSCYKIAISFYYQLLFYIFGNLRGTLGCDTYLLIRREALTLLYTPQSLRYRVLRGFALNL